MPASDSESNTCFNIVIGLLIFFFLMLILGARYDCSDGYYSSDGTGSILYPCTKCERNKIRDDTSRYQKRKQCRRNLTR